MGRLGSLRQYYVYEYYKFVSDFMTNLAYGKLLYFVTNFIS